MIRSYIGIDPGKTGAMALLTDEGEMDFADWSTPHAMQVTLLGWVQDKCVKYIGIEKVHSMPRQGVSSTFTFGSNFGWWAGTLDMVSLFLGTPWGLVSPQEWQKGVCGGKRGGDNEPLTAARRMFPDAPLGRMRDSGRADALLIALWAKKHWSH